MREREKMEKIEPASNFIDTRRGGVHVRGVLEVVVFSPNRRCTVDAYYRKYTVPYWRVRRQAWRSSWACGDCAGVPVAYVGVMASPVEGTVLRP